MCVCVCVQGEKSDCVGVTVLHLSCRFVSVQTGATLVSVVGPEVPGIVWGRPVVVLAVQWHRFMGARGVSLGVGADGDRSASWCVSLCQSWQSRGSSGVGLGVPLGVSPEAPVVSVAGWGVSWVCGCVSGGAIVCQSSAGVCCLCACRGMRGSVNKPRSKRLSMLLSECAADGIFFYLKV